MNSGQAPIGQKNAALRAVSVPSPSLYALPEAGGHVGPPLGGKSFQKITIPIELDYDQSERSRRNCICFQKEVGAFADS
jgi:hypothetical protein